MSLIAIGKVLAFPGSPFHPAAMVRALQGLRVPFDFKRTHEYRARYPEIPWPSTAYVILPIRDVVEALGAQNRIEAMIYWRDTARPYYLAIPVTCCTLNKD